MKRKREREEEKERSCSAIEGEKRKESVGGLRSRPWEEWEKKERERGKCILLQAQVREVNKQKNKMKVSVTERHF